MSRLSGPLLLLLAGVVLIYLVLSPQVARPVQSVSSVPVFPNIGSVRSGPTLSATFVNQVLALAGSPAHGLGQTLYQLSQQYGIDDAVALAFFHHESDYGRYGVAATTNNFGNLLCAGYTPCTSDDFRVYASWAAGAQDWYHLLATVYVAQGLVTVQAILSVYAPPSDENNDSAYSASVLSDVQRWHEGTVQP